MTRRSSSQLAQFKSAEAQLGALISEDRIDDVKQDLLDQIRRLYLVFGTGGEGTRLPVPASVNANLKTKKATDLPDSRDYAEFVKRVPIYDVLSSDCLAGLCQFGEAGRIAKKSILDQIHRNLVARIAATEYRPRRQTLGQHTYDIHNDFVELHPKWTAPLIQKAIDDLTQRGLWAQAIHDEKFGLCLTSASLTNDDMLRQWLLDSCMAGLIQRLMAPHLWPRNLITNAGLLCTSASIFAMLSSVIDPGWYRDGDASRGIAHIFLPTCKNSDDEGLRWNEEHCVPEIDSIKEDPIWSNRQRLESQAVLLCWLVRTIKAGAFMGERLPHLAGLGAPWGFHWRKNGENLPPNNVLLTERQRSYIITGIQVAAAYLLAVEWNGECYDFNAPTASAWEEAPLKGGCASDTCFMVDAMSELRDLLFNTAYDSNLTVQDVRQRLTNLEICHPEKGTAAQAIEYHPYADFRDKGVLDRFITAGRRKISQMVIKPVVDAVDGSARPLPSNVKQFPDRGPDTSLVGAAAFYSQFDPYLVRDARIRLNIVLFCEAHLMDSHLDDRCGMKRYGTFQVQDGNVTRILVDSYLNYQFNLGLTIPGMVVPSFAQMVETEYASVREYYDEREAAGTLSPRDILLRQAYDRFISSATDDQLKLDPRKDATDFAGMSERQQFSFPDTTAQWTIGVTAAIIALARAKQSLLTHLQTQKNDLARARKLLFETERALTRFINLALSTIVQNIDADGKPVLRADGTPLPATYNVMEAFQFVPDADGIPRPIPGDHTLPWSTAQLYYGLHLALEAAHMAVPDEHEEL